MSDEMLNHLCKIQNLEAIVISSSLITDNGFLQFFEQTESRSIKSIAFIFCDSVSSQGWASIFRAKSLEKLESLDLSGNNMDDDVLESLSKGVFNKTMKSLIMRHIHGRSIFPKKEQGITFPSLSNLCLDSSKVSSELVSSMHMYMSKTLSSLSLRGVSWGYDSLSMFFEVTNAQGLKELDLSKTVLQNSMTQILFGEKSCFRTLEKLALFVTTQSFEHLLLCSSLVKLCVLDLESEESSCEDKLERLASWNLLKNLRELYLRFERLQEYPHQTARPFKYTERLSSLKVFELRTNHSAFISAFDELASWPSDIEIRVELK
jgi:Leucine-rich repeat (LRR) protein